MDVALVLYRPDGRHRSFAVTKADTTIGRRDDCDLRIPLTDVSRKHCRLKLDAAGLLVSDLGSSNGTYVNGQRVDEDELTAGDVLQVGPVTFVVQVDGTPDADGVAAAAVAVVKPAEADADDSDVLEFDEGDEDDEDSSSEIIDLD